MWQLIAASIGLQLANKAYHRWMVGEPKKKRGPNEEVSLPRTDEGAPVPLVFGRVRVRQPILAWAGDMQYLDRNDANGQYRVHAVDLLFVAGIPMGTSTTRGNSIAGPKLHKVWWGDYQLPGPSSLPTITGTFRLGQNVTRPLLFGGAGKGGGLRGAYYWFGGWTDQSFTSPPSRTGDQMTPLGRLPGLARQMCVSFHRMVEDSNDPYFNVTRPDPQPQTEAGTAYPQNGFTFGEAGNLGAPNFEVSSYGDTASYGNPHVFSMSNENSDFGGDADPAEVIYCILTDPLGKLALSPSLIDTASFLAASKTLKSEVFGVSRCVEGLFEADKLIESILSTIDGVLDEDPVTGLIKLRLVRPDYDPNAIPHITDADCDKIEGFVISSWTGLINQVRCTFEDRDKAYTTASEIAKSSANALGQEGQVNEEVIDLPWTKRAAVAKNIAKRELDVLSRPTIKMSMLVKRKFIRLMRGDAVKVTIRNPDIAGLYFRVADINRGTLEDGAIRLDLISDTAYVFSGAHPAPPAGVKLENPPQDLGLG